MLIVLALQLTGCESYLFRQSDRVMVTYPAIHSTVHEPVTVKWQATGFSSPRDGRFAVFLDRDPMPPGNGLDYFDRGDREGIFVVETTSLRLEALSRRAGIDPAEQDHHDVTIVLLDRDGKRVGEYAGFTEFTVQR